ncbi:hypothetical protein [Halobaculum roseum]|uniref:DUF3784 domain-containing protein n=1 Tax=Halobaculum roseum TaxID=2175149 RepID=A0ABD5MM29_9EURY|nr:hypothetical protein [Halobaculum roseum]QZY03755.1 hypothetical protein K6T36_06230 [Halobaculum roseum]
MPSAGSLAVEWLASGAVVTLLGALIRFAGWTWLLAGYDESTSSLPDDVVGEMAGNTVLRVGVAVLAVGALASVTDPPSSLTVLVGAAILLDVGRLLYRLNAGSAARTT